MWSALWNTDHKFLMFTANLWQYLDENKQLILAILDNQNSGKLDECAVWVSPDFYVNTANIVYMSCSVSFKCYYMILL